MDKYIVYGNTHDIVPSQQIILSTDIEPHSYANMRHSQFHSELGLQPLMYSRFLSDDNDLKQV